MLTIKKILYWFNQKTIDSMFVGKTKTITVIVTTYNKQGPEILLLHQCTFSFHCFTQNDRLSYTFLWGFRLINIGINDLRTFNQSERDHEYINITVMYIQHYNITIYIPASRERKYYFSVENVGQYPHQVSPCAGQWRWSHKFYQQKTDQQISSNWPQLIDIKLKLLNTFISTYI